jgi:hypothetical protein
VLDFDFANEFANFQIEINIISDVISLKDSPRITLRESFCLYTFQGFDQKPIAHAVNLVCKDQGSFNPQNDGHQGSILGGLFFVV